MYIKNVRVENVKSFRGKHCFELTNGVNFFVGDNNSGKSTVLEALLFMFEGPTATRWPPEKFYCVDANGPTRVQVDIAGNVEKLVEQDKFAVLEKFVFKDKSGEMILRLERSSQDRVVTQNGKQKKLDVSKVCFWHPEHKQFENGTGIDALVKAMFDFEAVWANAQPGDVIDFGSTKTLGRLLDASFRKFVQTDLWKELSNAHEKAFSSDEEGSFITEANELLAGIKALVDEQYGPADYRFDFGLPDSSIFMKQGQLHVDDGAGETPVDGKGTGMQRAIALAIIQMYAKSSLPSDENYATPLILMLDEPETWLHPSAQLRLGEALSKIGERDQVFVITHSPYLIRKFDSQHHLLTVFSGKGEQRCCNSSTTFGLFGKGEPTWGEINYRAFEVCSNDFHNELYGYIQKYLETNNTTGKRVKEECFDNFLVKRGLKKDREWERDYGKRNSVTLPVYVRNSIHHPENTRNAPVTAADLRESTKKLVGVVEWINQKKYPMALPAPIVDGY